MKLSEIIKRYELGLIDFEQFITEFEGEAKAEERERCCIILKQWKNAVNIRPEIFEQIYFAIAKGVDLRSKEV